MNKLFSIAQNYSIWFHISCLFIYWVKFQWVSLLWVKFGTLVHPVKLAGGKVWWMDDHWVWRILQY